MSKRDPKKILELHIANLNSTFPKKRIEIVNKHCGVLNMPAMIEHKNLDLIIKDIIKKELTHPTVYLASSLGFTKTNWNRSIERLLNELGLVNRLKYPFMRNMKKYEKLKHLILKYFEKKIKVYKLHLCIT